jgi:hypothetical protein
MFFDGPTWITVLTPLAFMPIPKAIVENKTLI